MIKLLPITKCLQCHMLGSKARMSDSWYNTCTSFAGGRDIKSINEIPEWCPLDDAEVEEGMDMWTCPRCSAKHLVVNSQGTTYKCGCGYRYTEPAEVQDES